MYTVKVCTECGEEYCSGTCAVFQYESFQVKVQEARELVKPPTPDRGFVLPDRFNSLKNTLNLIVLILSKYGQLHNCKLIEKMNILFTIPDYLFATRI